MSGGGKSRYRLAFVPLSLLRSAALFLVPRCSAAALFAAPRPAPGKSQ